MFFINFRLADRLKREKEISDKEDKKRGGDDSKVMYIFIVFNILIRCCDVSLAD